MSAVEPKIVTVPNIPGLGPLYARGALGALKRVRSVGPDALPDTRLHVPSFGIDAERLVRYQRLMGDTLRDEVPSVFMHGTVFPLALSLMLRDGFPLPLLGMVHLSNRVEHRRVLRPSETFSATAWAQALRPHHAGATIELVVEAADADGEVVWRGVSEYLAKGVVVEGAPAPSRPERQDFHAPRTTARWRLGAGIGREYADVLGDYNPIHLSGLSAKALGFPRAIAHGMYLAGRALVATAPHGRGFAWEISFDAPVLLPGTVEFNATREGERTEFVGWDAKKGRKHFSGSVAL